MLTPIPDGYINVNAQGKPDWMVERCPEHLKGEYANVICIMPIRNNRVVEGKEVRRG